MYILFYFGHQCFKMRSNFMYQRNNLKLIILRETKKKGEKKL